MRKAYQVVVALAVAAASLTSCSRGNYAASQRAPAPLVSPQQMTLATTPAEPETMARVVAPAAPQRAVEAVSAAAPVLSAKPVGSPTAAVAKATHPTLMQRLVLKKVAKQVAKIQAIRQNTAHAEHTASNVKSSLLLLLAGLVIILIGGIIGGTNIVVTIGGIVFVVGLIFLVIALIDG